jgi:hypothetical protein
MKRVMCAQNKYRESLVFFNALRRKCKMPLLPEPPSTDGTEAVPPRQMGLAEYIASKKEAQ